MLFSKGFNISVLAENISNYLHFLLNDFFILQST